MGQRLADHAGHHRADVIRFATELIRTPSLSGDEEAVAALIMGELHRLGFDAVFADEVGNVVGVLKGTGKGPGILFCSHMDTSEPGDPELWDRSPYDVVEADGALCGLGASDSKGAIAAQVYGAAMLRAMGVPLSGDVIVACVVMAEQAEGFGIGHLFDVTLPAQGLKPGFVVMGDPTGLDVFLGQRGRLELEVSSIGRTSHASAPWLGVNAAYKMVPVIEGVHELAATLPSHPFLERSTIALTNLVCTPARYSMIPDRCIASLDRRFLPSETLDTIIMQVQSLISRVSAKDPEFKGEAKVRMVEETAYTGLTKEVPKLLMPFVTSERHPLVAKAVGALEALGHSPNFDKWYFSTEGGYVASVVGLPTIGYAPGEEKVSHTPYDRVRIDHLMTCVAGSAAIAQAIAAAETRE